MKTCRTTRTPNTVYTASCVNRALKSKRSVGGQISKSSLDITEDDERAIYVSDGVRTGNGQRKNIYRNQCFYFNLSIYIIN